MKEATPSTVQTPLSPEELQGIDAYWRAANYLSVGQIYLMDNPLLEVQVNRVVTYNAGILKDDGSEWCFAPPLDDLLIGLARGSECIQRSGPTGVRFRSSVEGREAPRGVTVLVLDPLQGFGPEELE